MVGVMCLPGPKPGNLLAGLSPSLASFIQHLPPSNRPLPNVDKVISALLHGDISFHKSGLSSTSRRANSSTMKSFQTSHLLKRKQDDDDKEEVVCKKSMMDIFKLRQIRKLKLQAMTTNQNQSGTTSRTTSGTTTSHTSSVHS
ncbi:cleavage stimulation factor subunit 77 isoform X2 [Cryptomeria japonica]|uniref:cleavage stimulation factor subunit 77 isoform X2 n=1 Tax=Cryptomeria japonica TaxID=3369 RepID=UPI0027DA7B3E|nr:cleavage stimulation factor subunit 77 isoform X2 [Cryptomeria japonica]